MVDFFVSYNQADRGWAEWIAWHLEAAGYKAIIQAWDFRPGENFVLAMNRAASEARRTIVVLSPAFLAARFTQPEWAAAFAQDPTGNKVLPVRVQDCNPGGLLGPIAFIDLVEQAEDAARAALLAGVREGRAKPTKAPSFPSSAASKPAPAFPAAAAAAAPVARAASAPPPDEDEEEKEEGPSDADVLRAIRARGLVELDTLDLDYELAKVFHDRGDIEGIVSDAEALLRSAYSSIDQRAAIFGVQNLPSPPASAQRIWRGILMEAPLKGPRALAAILLRARRLSGAPIPKLEAALRALVEAPGPEDAAPAGHARAREARQESGKDRARPRSKSGRTRRSS